MIETLFQWHGYSVSVIVILDVIDSVTMSLLLTGASLVTYKRFLPVLFTLTLLSIRHCHSMRTIRGDTDGGRGVTIEPRNGEYNRVILWFHGLGDTADGWSDLVPSFNLPNTKYILPTAPTRPISLNGGYSMNGWSDIYGLSQNSKEDKEGFDQSAARVQKIIQKELDKGVPSQNILVGGFSQGGALALHLALQSQIPLAGCIALSTWLPLKELYPTALTDAGKKMPILQMHGDEDQVVQFHWGKMSHEFMSTLITNPKPVFKKIEGMGHSWDNEELVHIRDFFNRVFPDSK